MLSRVMSVALGWALLASANAASAPPTVTIPSCKWTKPSADPYMGSTADALARFRGQFTPAQLAEVQSMVDAKAWTAKAVIYRDRIDADGSIVLGPAISRMHFGERRVCETVDRSGWKPEHMEGALVYWPKGSRFALIRPATCRNWSIVEVLRAPVVSHSAATGPAITAAPETFDDGARAVPPAFDDGGPGPVAFASAIAPALQAAADGGADQPAMRTLALAPLLTAPSLLGAPADLGGSPSITPPARPASEAPEPATLWLFGLALLLARLCARHKAPLFWHTPKGPTP